MSTYVMSDIHGCYDELMKILEKIQFSSDDTLIIAGDYMDRGSQSLEILDWILDVPDNVILLKGNHDAEFVDYRKYAKIIDDDQLDLPEFKDEFFNYAGGYNKFTIEKAKERIEKEDREEENKQIIYDLQNEDELLF